MPCRRTAPGTSRAQAGVITANNRWCEVDFLTFESIKVQEHPRARRRDPDRAGHAEVGTHGELAREGLRVGGRCAALRPARNPAPVTNNTCYSFVTDKDVVHVASVHQYDARQEDVIAAAGRRRTVADVDAARRRVRAHLGAEHLGGRARLNR